MLSLERMFHLLEPEETLCEFLQGVDFDELAKLLVNPAVGAEFSSHLICCVECRRRAGQLVQKTFSIVAVPEAVASN